MSLEDSVSKPAAPKWSRMPAQLRLQLEAAIAEHRRHHGSRHYDLLRNDRRFSPWTGTHLGYRGEKYLDRAIADVRKMEARLKRLRSVQQAPSSAAAAAMSVEARDSSAVITRLANAGGLSFAELMADLAQQRSVLKAEAAACHSEDGHVRDFDRWAKIGAELRTVAKAIADLNKQYRDVWVQGEVQKELLACVASEFRDDPARGRAMAARLNAAVLRVSGMAGASEASDA